MLDVRDTEPRRAAAHPVVYSRRRSPQMEWRDVTQPQPLDQARRQSQPDVQHATGAIRVEVEVSEGVEVVVGEVGGDDSSTTVWETGPVSSSRKSGSADKKGDSEGKKGGSWGEIASDAQDQDVVDATEAVDLNDFEAVGSKDSEIVSAKDSDVANPKDSNDWNLEAQAKPSQADASPVVIEAQITIPLDAPSKVSVGVASSGGDDAGRGEASSPSNGADSQEDMVHKGLVDFFSKLAVDWSKKTGPSTASTEPASTIPEVSAALEVLRKLILDFIKLYRRLVRRFEDQTQNLSGWAEDTTLDALWADMAKSFFCERSTGVEGFRDGAIMISSCQQTLQNAVASAQEKSKSKGNDYRMESEVRVAKKCIVCCDGIVELAKRAERERIACQHLIHELKDARDLLDKWTAANSHERRRESSRSELRKGSSERGSSQVARSGSAAESGSAHGEADKADQGQNDAIPTGTSAEIRIEVKEVREEFA